jgi:hypothetical protein
VPPRIRDGQMGRGGGGTRLNRDGWGQRRKLRDASHIRLTPKGKIPRLRSYRLEGGALMYICADQRSGQWLKTPCMDTSSWKKLR